MADFIALLAMFAVMFFSGYLIGGRKRSSASAGDPRSRERRTITHSSADADQGPIHGWGVWHDEDREWIGFGVTNSIAFELIPPGPLYEHLLVRRAVALIVSEEGD